MHSYLKSVGFSEITKRNQLKEIIKDVINSYDEKNAVEDHPNGVFVEYSKYYGYNCGITVCGQYDEDDDFHVEYYFPFFRGTGITTKEQMIIDKHAEKESFAGACDDLRVGVTLIYYLQNAAEYMIEKSRGNFFKADLSVTLSGLAADGKVLLPLMKDSEMIKEEKEIYQNRTKLIAAARNGDEEAMESLTMEDMDTYSMISQRIVTEDILSIVDSSFMPHGIECDQYKIIGEILDYNVLKNSYTNEEICQLTVDCNDVQFDVCINRKNLLGELQVGRRFKGVIWLQGNIHFRE